MSPAQMNALAQAQVATIYINQNSGTGATGPAYDTQQSGGLDPEGGVAFLCQFGTVTTLTDLHLEHSDTSGGTYTVVPVQGINTAAGVTALWSPAPVTNGASILTGINGSELKRFVRFVVAAAASTQGCSMVAFRKYR